MRIVVEHVTGRCFQATVGEHTVIVDSSAEYGEADTAPSAPQLFAVAVGACIGEFVVNSCRMHALQFERLSVQVEYEKEAQPRRIGRMEVTLRMEPQPSEEIKHRLIGIARHVTLVNTLIHPPEVLIRFASPMKPVSDPPASPTGSLPGRNALCPTPQ